MALGLERWFPNNNSAFAYGTRLCEETGELVEALLNIADEKMDTGARQHLIKEIEDVLQIITGILGIYALNDRFPKNLAYFMTKKTPYRPTKDDIIAIPVCAGQFADAINHMENQGVKNQKHGDKPKARLLEKANGLVSQITLFLQYYELLDDFERQIEKDYLLLAKKGLIE
ncbi:MAG TPA: hypothetical protein VFO38_02295 [Candidatus Saccharimonadales bacterium]|nr:hypothetical protein [Candidatus Saccharimonadales bacterium]